MNGHFVVFGLGALFRLGIALFDGRQDVGAEAEAGRDVHAGHEPEIVDGVEVLGLGHDGQDPATLANQR